jgi:ATP synthase protein I
MSDLNTDHDRLQKLSGDIAGIRAEEAIEKAKADQTERDATNMNVGVRAGAELVTCLIAGAGIGYGIDRYFHTQPFGLIVFLLTGIGLGFYEVYRITK